MQFEQNKHGPHITWTQTLSQRMHDKFRKEQYVDSTLTQFLMQNENDKHTQISALPLQHMSESNKVTATPISHYKFYNVQIWQNGRQA